MSNREKQFITVVGSKHKKPKAMFLANNESPAPWSYHAKYALILPLERVLAHCKWLSIPEEGIYLIDAENLDSFTDGFTDIKIKLSTFIMMCANTNRQIIRYLRKDLIPPIVAPSERQLADDTKVLTLLKEEERREKLVLTNCNGEFLVDRESLLFSRFVNKAVLFDSKQQIDEFLVEKGASGEFRFNTLLIADAEMVIAEGSRYSWALFEKALIPLSLPEHELAPHLFE